MKITLLILCKAKACRLRVWVKNWISKYNFGAHRLLCSHIKEWCDGRVYKATKLQIESLFGPQQWIRDLNQNIKKTSLCISSLPFRGQNPSCCVWLCKWENGFSCFKPIGCTNLTSSVVQSSQSVSHHHRSLSHFLQKVWIYWTLSCVIVRINSFHNPWCKRIYLTSLNSETHFAWTVGMHWCTAEFNGWHHVQGYTL